MAKNIERLQAREAKEPYTSRKAVGRKKQQALSYLLVYDFIAHLYYG